MDWVLTDEHLPADCSDAIVTVELKSGRRTVRMAKYTEQYGFSGNGNFKKVPAWMYAPDPYEEEENKWNVK